MMEGRGQGALGVGNAKRACYDSQMRRLPGLESLSSMLRIWFMVGGVVYVLTNLALLSMRWAIRGNEVAMVLAS